MRNEVASEACDREAAFHDEWAASIDETSLLVDESFLAPTALENRYCLQQIGDLEGKAILDMGCGAGEAAAFFASRGATVWAMDISSGMLSVARRLADGRGVGINAAVGSAMALPFASRSFDVVYGNGVLHHVDMAAALPEVSRVLRPGGLALFIEPLAYNPVINVYRHVAKAVRSEDERPLKLSDLREFRRHFSSVEHREMWFFSLYIFLWFLIVERSHPAKERYWKKVIKDGEKHRVGMAVAVFVDRVVLFIMPFLRFFCWNSVISVRK